MVTSINNPQVMGLGFRDNNSVPRYNTPTGTTTPRQDAAANLGYERGNSSPLGLLPGYNLIKGPLGLGKNDTFGNEGTSDAQGNVFNSTGRAYDPITGRAVASYKDASSGFNTLKNSYGKLRKHTGPIESALGSYDNSVYKYMDENPGMTKEQARTARLRGENAPMDTVASRINSNTNMYGPIQPVSPYDLGYDGSRAGTPTSTSGVFGSNAGDIIPTTRMSKGFGVMGADSDTSITYDNEGNYTGGDINIMTPGGTMGSIRDSVTGEMIQTNTMSPLLKQELDRRAGKFQSSRIVEPDGGGENKQIKSIPSRIKARKMNEFGDVITDDGDNATDSNSGGK
tara:strand:- start:33 stop:1055 length:1023 start_codon:yes stop_codon:yes gene_type:complete